MMWDITSQIVFSHPSHHLRSTICLRMTARWHFQLRTTKIHEMIPAFRDKRWVLIREIIFLKFMKLKISLNKKLALSQAVSVVLLGMKWLPLERWSTQVVTKSFFLLVLGSFTMKSVATKPHLLWSISNKKGSVNSPWFECLAYKHWRHLCT